jgi:hypothetical protein
LPIRVLAAVKVAPHCGHEKVTVDRAIGTPRLDSRLLSEDVLEMDLDCEGPFPAA